jgi:F-type H+-transporting ATPase subunit a
VRGAATDLNLTIGLALVTFFAIQVFGVAAQGPAYFQKFINIRALGTLQKKPLGAVDFLVGIFEIVSEIGKIISLAFRLFGNMFAGGILLAVMSFLVATLLPVVFYGLEVIVTSIQAFVFAVLTIVFSAQAMEGHHSDDEHAEHAPGEQVAAHEPQEQPINRTAI